MRRKFKLGNLGRFFKGRPEKTINVNRRMIDGAVKKRVSTLKKGDKATIIVGDQFTEHNQKATKLRGKVLSKTDYELYLEVNGRKALIPIKDIWDIK